EKIASLTAGTSSVTFNLNGSGCWKGWISFTGANDATTLGDWCINGYQLGNLESVASLPADLNALGDEGNWNKGNKLIRIKTCETKHSLQYVVSFTRLAYATNLLSEINVIENMYFNNHSKTDNITTKNILKHKENFFSKIFNNLSLIEYANASTEVKTLPTISAPPTSGASSTPSIDLPELIKLLTGASTSTSAGSSSGAVSVGGGSLSLSDISKIVTGVSKLHSAISIMSDPEQAKAFATDYLIKMLPELSSMDLGVLGKVYQDYHNLTEGVNQLPGSINTISGVINQRWGETNAVLKDLTDPTKLFTLCLSASAGMVIGSAIASMAVYASQEILTALYNFIHEKITHTKEKQILLNDFNEARKNYEKLMKKSIEIERTLDNLLQTKNMLASSGKKEMTTDEMLTTLTDWIASKEFDVQVLLDDQLRIHKAEKSREKWISCKKTQDEQEQLIEKLKNIKGLISLNTNKTMCESLKKLYNDLFIIEARLENYRADFLAAKDVFFDVLGKESQKKSEKFLYALEHAQSDSKKQEKRIEKETLKKIEELDKRKDFFITNCINELKKDQKNNSRKQLQAKLIELVGENENTNFFNVEKYMFLICEINFEKEYEKTYTQMKSEYQKSAPVMIEQHKKYAEKLLENIFALSPDPRLDKEGNLAALQKYFIDILSDQKSDKISNILDKEKNILLYCKKSK
ncbi:MAG: hypothetical protein HQK51_19610, partial [Oligoflexia bacterium]|nr:hypothetical protein [Oligoflexia bacterium]